MQVTLLDQGIISDRAGVWLKLNLVDQYNVESTNEQQKKNKCLINNTRLDGIRICLTDTEWSEMCKIVYVDYASIFFVNVLSPCFNTGVLSFV